MNGSVKIDVEKGIRTYNIKEMNLPEIKPIGGGPYRDYDDIREFLLSCPKFFKGEAYSEKGIEFADFIVKPLFFNELKEGISPFYLYVNVTTPEI